MISDLKLRPTSRNTTREKRVTLPQGLEARKTWIRCKRDPLTLPSRCDHHPRQVTSSSVVDAPFLQHIAMLIVNGSNVGEHVARRQKFLWAEESEDCGGE